MRKNCFTEANGLTSIDVMPRRIRGWSEPIPDFAAFSLRIIETSLITLTWLVLLRDMQPVARHTGHQGQNSPFLFAAAGIPRKRSGRRQQSRIQR